LLRQKNSLRRYLRLSIGGFFFGISEHWPCILYESLTRAIAEHWWAYPLIRDDLLFPRATARLSSASIFWSLLLHVEITDSQPQLGSTLQVSYSNRPGASFAGVQHARRGMPAWRPHTRSGGHRRRIERFVEFDSGVTGGAMVYCDLLPLWACWFGCNGAWLAPVARELGKLHITVCDIAKAF
jgi:hypothetical protein